MALASEWQCSEIEPGPDSHLSSRHLHHGRRAETRHLIVIPVRPCVYNVMVTVVNGKQV